MNNYQIIPENIKIKLEKNINNMKAIISSWSKMELNEDTKQALQTLEKQIEECKQLCANIQPLAPKIPSINILQNIK